MLKQVRHFIVIAKGLLINAIYRINNFGIQ